MRALYYNCGAADLFAETGEAALRASLDRQWENMVTRQMYITGGIGSRWLQESVGRDYELPSERAYAETCAAIANVMWNERMLAIEGDARYADVMELALYNGVLSGLSLDGQHYFYQNPLADDGTHRRQKWFGCACCPPNVARLLAYLPGLFYSTAAGDEQDPPRIYVHLYATSTAQVAIIDGHPVNIRQETGYPWDGRVTLHIDAEGTFALMLRIPGWCEDETDQASIAVNGHPLDAGAPAGEYAELRQMWHPGDVVEMELPMPVRKIESHPHAAENVHRLALARGPLIYCVEAIDNLGVDVRDVVISAEAEFDTLHRKDLLNGVTVLRGRAELAAPDRSWQGRLYRPVQGDAHLPPRRSVELTAVPYYSWGNRAPGRMQVWMRRR